MTTLLRDVRTATRFLLKHKAFSSVAVLCLGLGIGVSVAVFSATFAIALRQLPYPDPGSIVEVRTRRIVPPVDSKLLSLSATQDLIAQTTSFAAVGRYVPTFVTLTGTDEPEQVSGMLVAPEWFSVFGIEPVLGRRIQPQDVAGDAARVAVISHALWQRRFGGANEVVGSQVLMTAMPANVLIPFSQPGRPYTVIGVMPERSRFPVDGDVWMPLNPERQRVSMGAAPRSVRTIGVLARLKSGVSVGQANGELQSFGLRAARDYPETDQQWDVRALLLRDAILEQYSTILYLLLLAVNLVMLLTCVCVGGLLIARNRARHVEVAIRTILGATRAMVTRQFMTEGLVIAAVGGAIGLLLAVWLIGVVRAVAPPTIPRLDELRVDWVVFAYAALITMIAGVLVGLAPAAQLSTPQLGTAIKGHDHSRHVGGYRLRVRGLLIGLEIALAVPVTIGAVLMLRSVGNLQAVDVGYRTDHTLAATVRLSASTCAKFAACTQAFDQILESLHGLPGVESAALTSTRPFASPLTFRVTTDQAWEPRRGQAVLTDFHIVTPEYFRILGVPMLEGRPIGSSDVAGAMRVAVVNQALAKSLFGDRPAIGQQFSLAPSNLPHWVQVVGVVADTRTAELTKPATPAFYLPLPQANLVPRTVLLIRTTMDPLALAPLVTARIRAVDKNAPITAIETLDDLKAQQIAQPRFQAAILSGFAGLGVALAVVGIYGLISYATSARFAEFGVRRALGAGGSDIFRLVIAESLSTLGWGLTFGIGGAIAVSRLLRGQLYEVSAGDPVTFVLVPIAILIAALIGYALPAWRATVADPLATLRHH